MKLGKQQYNAIIQMKSFARGELARDAAMAGVNPLEAEGGEEDGARGASQSGVEVEEDFRGIVGELEAVVRVEEGSNGFP